MKVRAIRKSILIKSCVILDQHERGTVTHILVERIQTKGFNYRRPILVYESGKKHYILDGTHRFRACRHLKRKTISAFVLPEQQFQRLLNKKFCGRLPFSYCSLDEYIVLPNGKTYDDENRRQCLDY